MALATPFSFTTGPSSLPEVGKLSYNGCVFSPLFVSSLSGKVVKDAANRTTKYMEYTLTVDGYVTLAGGNVLANTIAGIGIDRTMRTLRLLLTAQGGVLIYEGRGFDLVVNTAPTGIGIGGGRGINSTTIIRDVAWGPVPEMLEFQPLGGGLSAKVVWKVTVRIPEVKASPLGILQLNYETVVSYDEMGYSTISVNGTLEVGITRSPRQSTRELTFTVDDFRARLEARILTGIDFERFRLTRREFNVSRDKRTLEWSISAEERPYMDLPPGCGMARGTYSLKPAKAGAGLVLWLCTLKATYTVRKDAPRRIAWLSYLALLRLRMLESRHCSIPKMKGGRLVNNQPLGNRFNRGVQLTGNEDALGISKAILKNSGAVGTFTRNALLLDFSFDEGLYQDSRNTSFSATWRIATDIRQILLASGLWRKLPDVSQNDENVWAISMKDINGTQSWLKNQLDPALDVIVDFGGPNAI